MAQDPQVDPIYGKPMTKGMRQTRLAFFIILTVGGMGLVTYQWRQQKKAMQDRAPKIDRSAKELNVIDPATPPKKATFAKDKKPAAGQGPASRE